MAQILGWFSAGLRWNRGENVHQWVRQGIGIQNALQAIALASGLRPGSSLLDSGRPARLRVDRAESVPGVESAAIADIIAMREGETSRP